MAFRIWEPKDLRSGSLAFNNGFKNWEPNISMI